MEGENSPNRNHPHPTVPAGNGPSAGAPGNHQHPPQQIGQQPAVPVGNGHPAVPSGIPQQPPNITPLLRPPVLQPGVQPQINYIPVQQQRQDPMMMQILHQLQQQQATINQLLVQQQQSTQQQQQAFARQQEEIIRGALSAINVHVPPNPEQILDSLASNIKEFCYEPEANITFSAWYTRYEDLFSKDAARLDDQAKVRLLLRKVGTSEHDRYVSYILPKSPKDVNFADTVSKLKSLFGTPESVLSRRYRCLQLTKLATEDYKTFSCRVNKLCVEFELSKLTEDQFKCLVFVCGLKQESDSEVRTRLLSRIEENSNVTLEQISDECQRLLNLKHDTAMIESTQSSSTVNTVRRNQQSDRHSSPPPSKYREGKPGSPCWYCGAMHFVKDCSYYRHKCQDCGQFGHKEGYCDISRKAKNRNKEFKQRQINSVHVNNVRSRRIFVTVQINGVPVKLQLDTASDISVISEHTWGKIGRPAKTPTSVKASTASGQPLKLNAEIRCNVTLNDVTCTAQMFVVKQHLNLLGLDLISNFNLCDSSINQFKAEGRESSNGVGFPKQNRKLRSFDRSSNVWIKFKSNSQWKWISGIVRERASSVFYNVQVADGRTVRVHINHMRSRSSSSSGTQSSQSSDKPHNHPLPLDIPLKTWNLPSVAVSRTAEPYKQSSSSNQEKVEASTNPTPSTSADQMKPLQEAAVSVEPDPASKPPEFQDVVQSSSSSLSSPSMQLPRRSTRIRRAPVRYNPFG